ncbi:hypothetical protein L596_030782 [Steinernema carpocapsae]|uniref:Uncharacterized protein n=1 Tax=Steinernema carpocapsae TaxID=34508 RepID=A0A4U5LNR3_STECR|nr:hypothetical protein L596_030782 [Steinernema carpocapsae]
MASRIREPSRAGSPIREPGEKCLRVSLQGKPGVFANEGISQARSFAFLAAFVQRSVKKQKSRRYLLANIYGTL